MTDVQCTQALQPHFGGGGCFCASTKYSGIPVVDTLSQAYKARAGQPLRPHCNMHTVIHSRFMDEYHTGLSTLLLSRSLSHQSLSHDSHSAMRVRHGSHTRHWVPKRRAQSDTDMQGAPNSDMQGCAAVIESPLGALGAQGAVTSPQGLLYELPQHNTFRDASPESPLKRHCPLRFLSEPATHITHDSTSCHPVEQTTPAVLAWCLGASTAAACTMYGAFDWQLHNPSQRGCQLLHAALVHMACCPPPSRCRPA